MERRSDDLHTGVRPLSFVFGGGQMSWLFYSAVQMNVVRGCVSAVLVDATFDHVCLESREFDAERLWEDNARSSVRRCI